MAPRDPEGYCWDRQTDRQTQTDRHSDVISPIGIMPAKDHGYLQYSCEAGMCHCVYVYVYVYAWWIESERGCLCYCTALIDEMR